MSTICKRLAKLEQQLRPVYFKKERLPGTNFMYWGDNSTDHGPVAEIFTVNGIASMPFGYPGHVNGAPDIVGTHPDLNLNDNNLAGTSQRDQWLLWGYMDIPADGFIRDRNQNTGEMGQLWLGQPSECCCSDLELIYERTVNTNASDRGLWTPEVAVSQGNNIPYLMVVSDLNAFSGMLAEFSTSINGTWSAIQSFQSKDEFDVKMENCLYELQESEILIPPLPCCKKPAIVQATSNSGEFRLWSGRFNEPDIHADNQVVQINQTRADAGWSLAPSNAITFVGAPDHVEIKGHHVANNTGSHWAHPHMEIRRNGVAIAEGSALHMDDSNTYSGRSSLNISFIDESPGINPVYTFVSREDDNRTMNNPTIVELSPITLKAVL
ncbi:hypothetical protein ACH42_06295 [Endozoicomonas sp. (ex Bugula neritina AB1)]|nr:hypothetical protein ACH42_06295 [Endozoicomonas sp. (ex Bugula neritina AB1)]